MKTTQNSRFSRFIMLVIASSVLTACSDFGQPMGIPVRSEEVETEEEYPYALDEEAPAKSASDSTPSSASGSESTAPVGGKAPAAKLQVAPKDVVAPPIKKPAVENRATPWEELTVIEQGVSLSADGEIDYKQMLVGCSKNETHNAEVAKKVREISQFSLPAADTALPPGAAFTNGLNVFPNRVFFSPTNFNSLKTADPAEYLTIEIACGIKQSTVVGGLVLYGSATDPEPVREITVIESTASSIGQANSPWKEKRIELKRSYTTKPKRAKESINIKIDKSNYDDVVNSEEYHGTLELILQKNEGDQKVNIFNVLLLNLIHEKNSEGIQLLETPIDSARTYSFVIESRTNAQGNIISVRYHRSVQPLPEPWQQREDEVLRSIVNVLASLEALSN